MFKFVNIIMVEMYKLMFDDVLQRVLEEMKLKLQPASEDIIGDWFLYKYFTILRVYGFTGEPYRLPVFLTTRIFSLEFMRKRLCADKEHFGAFKKYSNVKFSLKVGPFISKNKSAPLFIEKLLEVMDFQKEKRINYDPHHIISQRKQSNKNKPFDHQIVEGLDKISNLS